MSANLLETVGRSLYGPHWQADLAREMGISSQIVRRWMSTKNVPATTMARLEKLCSTRAQALEALRQKLEDQRK